MSWKKMFFKDAEDEPEEVKPKAPVTQSVQPTPISAYVNPSYSATPNGVASRDYNDYLDKELMKRDQPGPDYLEFSNALKGMIGKPLSEQQMYEITFGIYSAMGMTVDKLVASGQHYISVVDQEEKDFQADISSAESQKVTAKRSKSAELEIENQNLMKKIQDNNLAIQKLNEEATADENKLQIEKGAFSAAATNKKAQINDHINKLKNYINANVTK